jgi:S1-C subfamily serine protease
MRYATRGILAASLAVAALLGGAWYVAAEKAKQTDRPYLGIAVEQKKSEQPGVTLQGVRPEGPAEKAGLKKGDRIVTADGKEVKTFKDLAGALANHKAGDALVVKAVREGKEQSFNVTLGAAQKLHDVTPSKKSVAYLGVHSEPLTAERKEDLGVKVDRGAVVVDVLADSPAAKAGLHKNDVITHVGNAVVSKPEDLRDAIQKTADKDVTLKVLRGKQELVLKAHLGETAGGLVHGWRGAAPEDVHSFLNHMQPFFQDREKTASLEKKVQDLEKRIADLEKKVGK